MIARSQLHSAAVALCDAAEPISLQHSTEPDEYVIPAEELRELRAALHNLYQQEQSNDQ
jgi:PHD/YefM family antitoxin component YafN of YafNO toxin-antitoxin module